MSDFILDASVALACVLPDEKTPDLVSWIDILLISGDALVPAHWWAEVGNGLLMAARRKRISDAVVEISIRDLLNFDVLQSDQLASEQILDTAKISQAHNLTMYDAFYVHLALETHLPLVAFDRKMTTAARVLNIPILTPPLVEASS
jgi:predicted nucleic acid-binding protein